MLDRLDGQPFDAFKVLPIVRQERQMVLQGRRGNQEIHIADKQPGSAEPPAFTAEDLGCFLIEANERNALKKLGKVHRRGSGRVEIRRSA